MNGESEHQSEEHGLRSWHPAHMPISDNTSAVDAVSSHDEAADPSLNHHDSVSSSYFGQQEISFSDRLEEEEPQVEPTTNGILNRPEAEPQRDARFLKSDDEREWDHTFTSEGDHPVEAPDVKTAQQGQSSGVVNGISIVREASMELEGPNLSHSMKEEQENGNSMTFNESYQDSEAGYDGKITPDFGVISRTNSFPAVPPLHQAHRARQEAGVQLQVDSVIEEDEEIENRAERSLSAGTPTQGAQGNATEPKFFEDSPVGEGDDLFGRSVNVDGANQSLSPADDEARFEEGLPLIQAEPSTNSAEDDLIQPREVSQDIPKSTASSADKDFFGENGGSSEEAFFKPKPIDRKNTSQVLDSLSYPPRHLTHDDPPSQKDRPSLEKISGGGIAVSSSTVVSQVVAEGSQSAKDSPAGATKKTDEDLAAMWQAALDDDELLDDSDPTSSLPSPSKDISAAPVQQDLQSPLLRPVYGADGKMQGFDYQNSAQSNSPAAQHSRYSPAQSHPTAALSSHADQFPSAPGQQPRIPLDRTSGHSSLTPSGYGQSAMQQPPKIDGFAPPRPSMPKPAQSFSDKSKGGYTSPYDLPMDITRPKKRTNLQQVQNLSSSQPTPQPPPPPRSSSMYTRSPPSDGPLPPVPPLPDVGAGPSLLGSRPVSSAIKEKPSVGSFFEELPVTKSRPSSSTGRYTPAPPPPQVPSQLPPRSESLHQKLPLNQIPSDISNTTPPYQLVPPERHSPYANLPQQDVSKDTVPQTNSRYSPAPGLQSHVPPPRNRYAASPSIASRQSPSTNVLPFQPRTSSPLAQNAGSSQQQYRHSSLPQDVPARSFSPQMAATSQKNAAPHHPPALPQVQERYEPSAGYNVPRTSLETISPEVPHAHGTFHHDSHISSAPTNNLLSGSRNTSSTASIEPSLASTDPQPHYLTHPRSQPHEPVDGGVMGPPRRSQTQSPGALRSRPEIYNKVQDVDQRPTSANDRFSPVRAERPSVPPHAPPSYDVHGSSQDLNYIRPTDGREQDPLERWKGAPIFKFGFGGLIMTSFPKHIPRYAAGHGFPMIKCSPGEVKLQTGNVGTLDSDVARFPGPLKSKGKKKELLEWLQKRIETLENVHGSMEPSSSLPDSMKKHEEKILLWKTMKVFVEYDGAIAGNSNADSSIRTLLCPAITPNETGEPPSVATSGTPVEVLKPGGIRPSPDMVSPGAMETVRTLLLQGEREKAVWHAVDQRMWAHAMVLSSTLDKSVWKQVLHEFTRLEVRTFGENTESLAALYEVFAGNWDESIDQLVPPSARAGLQMVSKAASAGPTRNALDGLDRWRETLTFILSNRTQEDENALIALGRLVAGYGRTEAAHLCLVFAKATGLFGGTDDSQTSVALLGADHQQQPFDYGRDLDSILLTEVYEFIRSVLAPSAGLSVSPHLQPYKLYHAILLAENGHRSEAQQYCDAIMSTLKSTTKPSPYYHSLLFNALDDLVERLQQAPRDTSSWMSKPMDKVSGSMWKKFNNFIVGDESDAISVASGKGEQDAGPFARIAAETPSISRAGSSTDLYNTFGAQAVPSLPASTAFGSRYAPSNQYAPSGQYTPRSSLEQQTHPSEEHQRHGQSSMPRPSQLSNFPNASRYAASPGPQQELSMQHQKPRYQPSAHISPKPDAYLPTPPLQPEYMPAAPLDDPSTSLYLQEGYQPNTQPESQAPQDHRSQEDSRKNSFSGPDPPAYEPDTSAYEPPSLDAPYDPEGQDHSSPTDQRSPVKKRSFMDDDDDEKFAARAAAILQDDKARKDKEADDAFRKAAEADAQKDQKDLKAKKSWFGGVGGWLGGKKDDSLNSQEPKAIKAKLGEESSFYYDKELKKWINKKGPAPTASEAPKPPPPKGPPSRAVSAAGGPPPPSMSRTSTPPVPPLPAVLPGQTGTPPINVSQPSPLTNPTAGPPSGSSTPLGRASPAIPPASTGNGGVDSQNMASARPSKPPTTVSSGTGSIDDLIGEPQARKGGTVRRGKKGRGYVDVMAK
ncbi:MAG: hypothetical protein Q9219_005952 [cf. Caloplaca sp. 3 TL-2023]